MFFDLIVIEVSIVKYVEIIVTYIKTIKFNDFIYRIGI